MVSYALPAGAAGLPPKCGGVYEDTRFDPGEQVSVKRYWINL